MQWISTDLQWLWHCRIEALQLKDELSALSCFDELPTDLLWQECTSIKAFVDCSQKAPMVRITLSSLGVFDVTPVENLKEYMLSRSYGEENLKEKLFRWFWNAISGNSRESVGNPDNGWLFSLYTLRKWLVMSDMRHSGILVMLARRWCYLRYMCKYLWCNTSCGQC